jgi:IMP dehydrogenase/GMP reductase
MTTARQSNEELFAGHDAYTFDDVVIVPAYSSVLPDTADVSSRFAADITLAIPSCRRPWIA